MRRLAHLSDLHFGTTEPELVDALAKDVREFNPHLVVITGDLTQRAKRDQFEQAKSFIDSLPFPRLIVPGNHDIAPLYRPILRLFDPFRRYREFFGKEVEPLYADKEILVIGVNSVQPLRWKEGRISLRQIDWIATQTEASRVRFRVLALHHPLLRVEANGYVRHRRDAPLLRVLDEIGIDLVLMGHLHRSYSGIAASSLSESDSLLVVQASTATSSRLRGHLNGYNRIRLDSPGLAVEQRVWNGRGFVFDSLNEFERMPLNWRRVTHGRAMRRESA